MGVIARKSSHYAVWWALFLAFLTPLSYISWRLIENDLGAEPAKALVEFLGETALWLLLITLSVTPLSRLRSIPSLVRYRRMIGLFVFFYAVLHIASYGLFLVDWANFVEDLYQRKYISVGAVAFLIIAALAVTSPRFMLRKLGRKWKSLHKMIYLASILVVVHVIWQVRADYTEAALYGFLVGVLLFLRWKPVVAFVRR